MDDILKKLNMDITLAISKIENTYRGRFDIRNPDASENAKKMDEFKVAISNVLAQFYCPHDHK